jgi:transcriptional regulator GlxA family with amidase domain
MSGRSAARRVVIVVFPGVQALDAIGPLDVFSGATEALARRGDRRPGYRCVVASLDGRALTTGSGFGLVPSLALGRDREPIDTLLVAGALCIEPALADRALVDAIGAAAGRARRVASVCSGALLLAAAGLLDGKRATTHWAALDTLARRFPRVRVERGPIHVADGRVHTSAGVTAGLDLALDLVEADYGRDTALEIARWMVMFVKRPGNQEQFSAQLGAQIAAHDPLRRLQATIADRPDADLSVPAMARRVSMSQRNFARLFRRQVGVAPGRYVEATRIEAAKRRLAESSDGIKTIAASCGFGTADTMRRAFMRRLGTAPSDYRKRFGMRRRLRQAAGRR